MRELGAGSGQSVSWGECTLLPLGATWLSPCTRPLPLLTPLGPGSETTARLLSWCFLLLALFPEWQQRLRREVRAAAEKAAREAQREAAESTGAVNGGTAAASSSLASALHWDDLEGCKDLSSVIWETLRLFPPAAFMAKATNKAGTCC